MAEAIKMPRMSDTMTEGVIVEWHKKVGDTIKPGDLLADVETDKATMELESYNEGTLLYIAIEAGKPVPVEGLMAIVGKPGEDYKAVLEAESGNGKEAKSEAAASETPKTEAAPESKTAAEKPASTLPADAKLIRMPLLSDTMKEGKIIRWNKKVGDTVKSDDALCEVETDKASMEVVGYEEGTLLLIAVEAGQSANINQVIAIVGKAGTDVSGFKGEESADTTAASTETKEEAPANQVTAPQENKPEVQASSVEGGRVKASPLAKKMASEKGIDLAKIQGSGDGGRIVKKDVDNYVPAPATAPAAKTENKKAEEHLMKAVPAFAPAATEGYEDITNTQMRKTIARRLGESKYSAPHFYLTMEINMDNAIASRSALNDVSPVKISFNDLVIKACAMALRLHPAVNSSWMGDFIRQNKHIHIGSAVAMPEGLIVPVIRFADQKSLSQIASDAKTLYEKARNKKLQPEEFSGNTFTISNLGMMDIDQFTAIINPPDSAILAVGAIKEVVVKKGDGFGVANIMKVTLSCDHRSVDGAVGAAFLQTVKKFLENPVTMLV